MMGWSTGVLSDLVFFQRGFDITKNEQRPGPYPVVSSSGAKATTQNSRCKGLEW